MNVEILLESVSFDELRPIENIDKESFTFHLKEIFKDLSEPYKNDYEGIYFNRFSNLIPKCSVFVGFKFFNSLLIVENKNKAYLSLKEFLEGITTLRYGTYDEVASLIFNIFDFDKDGDINIEDVKLLISYFPLKINNQKPEYLYQMDSLIELDQIIRDTFNEVTTNIKFNDFLNYIDGKANIFLMVFCYLYSIMPVLGKDIIIKHINYESTDLTLTPSSFKSNSTSISNKQLQFSSLSIFSPISNIKSKRNNTSSCYKVNKANILDLLSTNQSSSEKTNIIEPDLSIKKSSKSAGTTIMLFNSNSSKCIEKSKFSNSLNILKNKDSNIETIKCLIPKNTIVECLKETSCPDIFASMGKKDQDKDTEILDNESEKSFDIKESIKYEGEFFMLKNKDGIISLNYFYLALIGQSIYYYKNAQKNKQDYYECTYLPGCFFRENQKEEIGCNYFYSFSLVLPNKNMDFFHKDHEEIKNWIKKLRQVLSFENLFDFYNLGDTIGNGAYGVIKEGFDKNSNKKVAIKILTKAKIRNLEQLNLIRSEIDI